MGILSGRLLALPAPGPPKPGAHPAMNTLIPTSPPAHLDVPTGLSQLVELAYNLWWTWNRDARAIFKQAHPENWNRYRNPVRMLQMTRRQRLEELASDPAFLAELSRVHQRFVRSAPSRPPGKGNGQDGDRLIAYVSAEYALHESLPIYSGGLGVLSGDHLKEASDMRLPLLAVGLFYRRGYFHQIVDADGYQQHFYPDLDALRLPLLKVVGEDGRTLRVPVELDDRMVSLRAWVAQVGHVPLLLLDSFSSHNPPEDRYITSQLYVRGREMRLEQELLLGRGAVAVLDALGIRPDVYHMNEGHSAFLALENARRTGKHDLRQALDAVRERHAFTTHTPVPAGNETFRRDLVRPYLAGTARDMHVDVEELLELGNNGNPADFNLTALALRTSARSNGVSQVHAEVSREMWPGHDIVPITNGVHMSTWLGREVAKVLGAADGAAPAELARRASELADGTLWAAHMAQKHRLMRFVRVRMLRQAARHGRSAREMRAMEGLLNPAALTLGFARRFASYKRADLLMSDPARLGALLNDPRRPVQIILAGKAHPADRPGQEIIRRIWELARSDEFRGRLVFLEDYDMAVGRLMVHGVDVWLNTPEWPREASGTSGMKAVANGVLHASVPDGWWAEAHGEGLGFTLGEAVAPDPARDARLLYELIESRIVPHYYGRTPEGLPAEWIATMRRSMTAFLERFSTRRMLGEYCEKMYGLTGAARPDPVSARG